MRIERVHAQEVVPRFAGTGGAAGLCFLALPPTAPDGGISPFDSRLESERLSVWMRTLIASAVKTSGEAPVLALYGAPEWATLALMQCPPSWDVRAWIAVACRASAHGDEWLRRSHRALVVLAPRGSNVEFAQIRIPHRRCAACGEFLRDWGGRIDRMCAEGTLLSDVWTDLDIALDDPMPEPLVERLRALLALDAHNETLGIVADESRFPVATRSLQLRLPFTGAEPFRPRERVVQGDCLEVLRAIPTDAVDLAFADPPYNLEKPYASSHDRRRKDEYLGWCHAWLTQYARVVKPGGTLAVLTLPRWATAHARFLLRHRALRFRRWIVWDALAEPKGRGLLPAHYALLVFTKGFPRAAGATPIQSPESASDLCRRPGCIAARPATLATPYGDVWSDIPRVRHARHRDPHPCQLPRKLVERIITLSAPPGGIVLDAFCGTGTSGVAALSLARFPALSDISSEYVELAAGKMRDR